MQEIFNQQRINKVFQNEDFDLDIFVSQKSNSIN